MAKCKINKRNLVEMVLQEVIPQLKPELGCHSAYERPGDGASTYRARGKLDDLEVEIVATHSWHRDRRYEESDFNINDIYELEIICENTQGATANIFLRGANYSECKHYGFLSYSALRDVFDLIQNQLFQSPSDPSIPLPSWSLIAPSGRSECYSKL